MKSRQRHPLPFLVTLAGCVLMLAWVDPVNATEVTRQLTQKGYGISQLRKSEVAIVKSSNTDLKLFFKGFDFTTDFIFNPSVVIVQKTSSDYNCIFPNHVKSALKADIRTWLKRE